MLNFEKIVEHIDGVVVLTEDGEAMLELQELINALPEATGIDKIVILKSLETWAYRHPKELEQIRRQIEWKVVKNA